MWEVFFRSMATGWAHTRSFSRQLFTCSACSTCHTSSPIERSKRHLFLPFMQLQVMALYTYPHRSPAVISRAVTVELRIQPLSFTFPHIPLSPLLPSPWLVFLSLFLVAYGYSFRTSSHGGAIWVPLPVRDYHVFIIPTSPATTPVSPHGAAGQKLVLHAKGGNEQALIPNTSSKGGTAQQGPVLNRVQRENASAAKVVGEVDHLNVTTKHDAHGWHCDLYDKRNAMRLQQIVAHTTRGREREAMLMTISPKAV